MINFGIPYPIKNEECEILVEIIETEKEAKLLKDIISPIKDVLDEYNEDIRYEKSLRGKGVIEKDFDINCETFETINRNMDIEEQLIIENKNNNYKLY